ncbi:MAG: GGDEF domain-containing protein [Anaerolineales bacterium]|nr:GGDEF domain-containing protein [Anaerolineales bacterium]
MKLRTVSFYASLVYLENQSRTRLVGLSALLTALLGTIDYLTGYEMSFSFFYLIPVAIVSWGVDRRAGLVVSAFSAALWATANFLAGEVYPNTFAAVWNTLMLMVFFIIISLLLHALRRAIDEERSLARTDPLTGALNRRAFYELVNSQILFVKPGPPSCTLVYIDLDNFKPINDEFGHAVGDIVLTAVVHALAGELRGEDALARLGGDEFILLLMETDRIALEAAITGLQQALHKAMQAQDWKITFSIGVMTFLQPPGSVSQMISLADQLMYRVKVSTKNAVAYATFPRQFETDPRSTRISRQERS